jgi:hypothetical protein
VQTVYSLRAKGIGPRARRVGKYLRYRPEDVIAWFDGPDAGPRLMARPCLPLGSYDKITVWQDGKTFTARTKFRDFDGVVRLVKRTGKTRAKARLHEVEVMCALLGHPRGEFVPSRFLEVEATASGEGERRVGDRSACSSDAGLGLVQILHLDNYQRRRWLLLGVLLKSEVHPAALDVGVLRSVRRRGPSEHLAEELGGLRSAV